MFDAQSLKDAISENNLEFIKSYLESNQKEFDSIFNLRNLAIGGKLAIYQLVATYRGVPSLELQEIYCHLAIFHGHVELVNYFMGNFKNESIKKLTNELISIVDQRNTKMLSFMIQIFSDFKIEVPEDTIYSALSRSVNQNAPEVRIAYTNFMLLFNTYRHKIDTKSEQFGRCLSSAVCWGIKDLTVYLLENIPEINSISKNSAFLRGAESGRIFEIKLLLDKYENDITDDTITRKLTQIAYDYPDLFNEILKYDRVQKLLYTNPRIAEQVSVIINAPDYISRLNEHLKQQYALCYKSERQKEAKDLIEDLNNYFIGQKEVNEDSSLVTMPLLEQIKSLRQNPFIVKFNNASSSSIESSSAEDKDFETKTKNKFVM